LNACGFHAFGNAVVAERTFLSRLINRVEESYSIWAGHDTVTAADAPGTVNENDAILRLICGAHGADLHTGRLLALVAEFRNKKRFGNIFRGNHFAMDFPTGKTVSSGVWRVNM
jgi:hypothetical protein